MIEAFERRAETLEIFLRARGGERRERAPVKRALERNHPVLLRLAAYGVILARHFDRALHRLGAGIGEEHRVGETRRGEPLSEPLRLGNAKQIGDMPDLRGLLRDRGQQLGVRVAK